jgi:methyl-accepting chemotaxis protein
VKHNQINLNARLNKQKNLGEKSLITLEDYLNFFISSISETIEFLVDRSQKLSIFSSEINYYTLVSQQKSDDQIRYAKEIINLVQKLLDSFKIIVAKGKEAFHISDEANLTYQKGNDLMDKNLHGVNEIEKLILFIIEYMAKLKKYSVEISLIIKTIMDMSKKTNILSLNASIEAVRAGEAGRGFKIVADEIQKFSIGTTDATKKIAVNLANLNDEMSKSIEQVENSKVILSQTKAITHDLKIHFDKLSQMIKNSLDATAEISNIAENELSQVQTINLKIHNIETTISDFKDDFILMSNTARYITKSSEEITRFISTFQMNDFQSACKTLMVNKAKMLNSYLRKFMSEGVVTESMLLEPKYFEKKPGWFQCAYDEKIARLFESELQELAKIIEKEATEHDKRFICVFFMDKNGYVPVFVKNKELFMPSEEQEKINFSRKILKDPISLKAASHKEEFLSQVFMNSDGSQYNDLAVPLTSNDKIFGQIRMQYVLSGM